MFYKLSERIVDGFEKQRVILSEDKEIYRYGVQQGLNLAFNFLTTLVIGAVCGMFWESVLFMAAYMPLRSFAGGYHAKTHLRCYLYSIVMITAVLLVIRFLPLG
ncbi:MAG: accessory gene regulator B family protein, partial [Oscillospiraceae bacterium]|nr:accessory gene regulator B family protein [Oscillospiraceae bacterium]